jgi:starch-binding outer membrane protein, SusD/RagB family
MKTSFLKKVVLVSFIATVFFGCKKGFLNNVPEAIASVDNYYQTETECLKGVTGIYDVLGWNRTFDGTFWLLGDGATDDCDRDCNDAPNMLARENVKYTNVFFASANQGFEDMFTAYYEGISRANSLLARSNGAKVSPAFLARVQAEAKTLRALYYFMLVNYFGDVPLVTLPLNPLAQSSIKTPRSSVAQVYAQVEKDLVEAIPNLPLRSKVIADGEPGRMTKGAAGALLAKAYLYQKKYAQAIAAADEVMASAQYSLHADYRKNFKLSEENGVESVFEIQHNQNSSGGWNSNEMDGSLVHVKVKSDDGFGGGWGTNGPSPDLFDAFEAGDNRRKNTCVLQGEVMDGIPLASGSRGFGVMGKHWIPGYSGTPNISPMNWVLIRYADVLLMKAEAMAAMAAPTASAPVPAANILVDIRNRAGLTIPTIANYSILTADQLLAKVRQERRVEFGEEAWRLFDLRRWGADSLKNALLRVGKIPNAAAFKPSWLLFPIPQAVIDLSGGAIVQTQGPW